MPSTSVQPIPFVEPVPVLQRAPDQPPVPRGPRYSWLNQGYLPWLLGWAWRIPVGVCLVLNSFPLSYFTSVLVFGWLYRWMQVTTLRGWWRQSRLRDEVAFHDFCASLGDDAPSPRPRWFWHERPVRMLNAPGPDGRPAGFFRTLGRWAKLPVYSLWLNATTGVAGLAGTYLVMIWPCAMILFSWYFGWTNSFNKGYEDYWIGPTMGLLGFFTLIAALFYVPMAQAHQAAAGQLAAFFQVRVVWRLIKARLTAYLFVSFLVVMLSLVLEVVRCWVLGEDFAGNVAATPEEGLAALRTFLFGWSVFFFVALLSLRTMTALVYRSAVLKCLRTGSMNVDELPPRLADWLRRLDLVPDAVEQPTGVLAAARTVVRWNYQRMLFVLLFGCWLLFAVRFYIGYFLVFNDFRGPLNQPVVQLPTIDATPWHLFHGQNEEQLSDHPKF